MHIAWLNLRSLMVWISITFVNLVSRVHISCVDHSRQPKEEVLWLRWCIKDLHLENDIDIKILFFLSRGCRVISGCKGKTSWKTGRGEQVLGYSSIWGGHAKGAFSTPNCNNKLTRDYPWEMNSIWSFSIFVRCQLLQIYIISKVLIP